MGRINWLAQIVVGAELNCLDCVSNVALARNHYDRQLQATSTQFAEHFEPVFFGQAQVEQHDMGVEEVNQLQTATAVRGNFDRETPCRYQLRPSLAGGEIVFHNQDAFFCRHRYPTTSK